MAPRSLLKSPYLLASGYSYHSATATFSQCQSLLESGYLKNLVSAQQRVWPAAHLDEVDLDFHQYGMIPIEKRQRLL